MRTAPHGDRPAYLLPMPDEAARLLARAVHDRGEDLAAVNGALPAAQVFADELGRLTGRHAEVGEHTRLHELGELVEPPPGARARCARPPATTWTCAARGSPRFHVDADEQAGRAPGPRARSRPSATSDLLRRIDAGRIWLWEDGGEVVHLTGANAPAFGVARVGPGLHAARAPGPGLRQRRGGARCRGSCWTQGARACLFTDQANPTSNKIYAALGYRPVVDMANVVLR